MKRLAVVIAVLAAAGCSGGGSSEPSRGPDPVVSSADAATHGFDWPLTFDSGTVHCYSTPGGQALTITRTGTDDEYPLNGTAKDFVRGVEDTGPVWKVAPDGFSRVPFNDLIAYARSVAC